MSLTRRNRNPTPIAGPPSGSNDKYKLAFKRTDSFDTVESDTAQNQRGPGHSLEVIYTFFGTQLEKWINKLVVKSGRTPTALKAQLDKIGRKMKHLTFVDGKWEHGTPRPYDDFSQLTAEETGLMTGLCKSILKYVK